jgi:hypothetical protein
MRNGNPFEQPFQSLGGEAFQNGWKFRLTLSSPESGFLYIVTEPFGSTTKTEDGTDTPNNDGTINGLSILYPEPLIGSNSIQPNQNIQTDWYVFDQNSGTEKLWVIWSDHEVSQLERVRRFLNAKDRGLISETDDSRAVMEFLATHSSTKPEIKKDAAKGIIISKAEGSILTSSLELVHR